MGDYEAVPRALSRLARTAREIIPMRAQAEERRARIGLTKARTEFEVGEAKETRAHRERVFEAGEKGRGEVREHRAWEREMKEPILKATGAAARRKLEELEYGEKPANFADLFGGLTAEDMPHVVGDLLPAFEKGLGLKISKDVKTNQLSITKDGQPYKRWQLEKDADLIQRISLYNTDPRRLMETWADPMHKGHEWHEKAKKMLKDNDEEAIQRLGLKILRKFPPGRGASPAVLAQYNAHVKWTQDQIEHYQEAKKGKAPATAKFTYYDRAGKPHTQFIAKEQFPEAEKTVRDRGGTMEKPEKKAKPTATNQKKVLSLIDQYTAKGANKPTAAHVTAINDAANEFGYEYKHVIGPIRKADKRWFWWDPDKKGYWTFRAKTTEKPLMRGPSQETPPANILKEGVRTTFKNGQVWTLENGVPTLIGETGVVRRKITR